MGRARWSSNGHDHPKPIDSNRGSGRKSTGPASPEGKTASRVHALKTSLAAQSCAIQARARTPKSSEPSPLDATTRSSRPAPTNAFSSTLIDADWRFRRLAGLEAPPEPNRQCPRTPFRGLNEDGSLDEVFDSLDTFKHLEHRQRFDRAFSPPPLSPGCCASTWQRGQPHPRPNSLKSRAVSSNRFRFF